jgi:hypothetical protein
MATVKRKGGAPAPEANEEEKARGRKTKRTPELEKVLFGAIKKGCTHKAACGVAGIHPDTFYTWLNDFPDFADSVTEAENQAEAAFTQMVFESAREDGKFALEWLKRRRRAEWGDSIKQELSGGVSITRKAEDLSDDELASIAARRGE